MGLKDLFIKTDEPETPVKKQPVKTAQKVTTKPATLEDTPHTDTAFSAGDSKKDDYKKTLIKAIQDAHTGHPSAPDYVEFVKALSKMEGKPMDEETKFTSIFAGFEVQGVTVDNLINAANHYKDVVTNEKEQFETSIAAQTENTIGKAKSDITELTAKNASIDTQMKALADQKLANSKQIDTLNNSIQTNSNKIENRKSDFKSAYTEVITEIDNNISLIQKHLKQV